jgi:hypothetical protein
VLRVERKRLPSILNVTMILIIKINRLPGLRAKS